MKEKIRSAVKTAYAKFGLKAESIEKIVNIIETRLVAMGTIANEDEVIASEVTASEPLVAVIQSEVDSRTKAPVPPVEAPKTPVPPVPAGTPPVEEVPQWAKNLQERLDAQEKNEKAAVDRAAFVATIKATKGFENEKIRNMLLSEVAFDLSKPAEENTALFKTKYDQYCSDFGSVGVIPGFGNGLGAEPGSGGLDAFKATLISEGKIPQAK